MTHEKRKEAGTGFSKRPGPSGQRILTEEPHRTKYSTRALNQTSYSRRDGTSRVLLGIGNDTSTALPSRINHDAQIFENTITALNELDSYFLSLTNGVKEFNNQLYEMLKTDNGDLLKEFLNQLGKIQINNTLSRDFFKDIRVYILRRKGGDGASSITQKNEKTNPQNFFQKIFFDQSFLYSESSLDQDEPIVSPLYQMRLAEILYDIVDQLKEATIYLKDELELPSRQEKQQSTEYSSNYKFIREQQKDKKNYNIYSSNQDYDKAQRSRAKISNITKIAVDENKISNSTDHHSASRVKDHQAQEEKDKQAHFLENQILKPSIINSISKTQTHSQARTQQSLTEEDTNLQSLQKQQLKNLKYILIAISLQGISGKENDFNELKKALDKTGIDTQELDYREALIFSKEFQKDIEAKGVFTGRIGDTNKQVQTVGMRTKRIPVILVREIAKETFSGKHGLFEEFNKFLDALSKIKRDFIKFKIPSTNTSDPILSDLRYRSLQL